MLMHSNFLDPRYSGAYCRSPYTLSKTHGQRLHQRDVVPQSYDVSSLWDPQSRCWHTLVFNYLDDLPFSKTLQVDWKVIGVGKSAASHSSDWLTLQRCRPCGYAEWAWTLTSVAVRMPVLVVSSTPKIIGPSAPTASGRNFGLYQAGCWNV